MSSAKTPTPPAASNGATPAAGVKQPCPNVPKPAMTEAEAQKFMNDFKKTDIPFDYPVDCCFARARKMCGIMEKAGYETKKFWYGGNLNASDLHPIKPDGSSVDFPPNSGNDISWRYHVAPLVSVQHPDGTISNMVLDPSLSDQPLSPSGWKHLAGSSPTPSEVTTPSDTMFPWPTPTGKMSEADADTVMQDHRDKRDTALGK